MVECSRSMLPPGSVRKPPQSVVAGVPDPVAPPTALSLIDVNVIGEPLVPTAVNVPEMSKAAPLAHQLLALTIAPACTVSVTPLGTCRQLFSSHGVAEAASVDDV